MLGTQSVIISNFRQIRFIADDPDADYYEWQIGAGTYHTASVTLSLSGMGSLLPIDIPARLIIHKEADTGCFPNDNGIDTLERSLHIIKDGCEPLWEGSYQGYLEGDSPTDTFTVSLEHESPDWLDPIYCSEGIRMINWDRKGCNWVTPSVKWTAYRYMSAGGGNTCSHWLGYIWVNPKGDSIQAHYRLSVGRDSNNKLIFEDRVFNGKRIK